MSTPAKIVWTSPAQTTYERHGHQCGRISLGMAQRVNLDAMIPREDFGVLADDAPLELIRDFPISNLESTSPVRRLLRKPDFQRETNHWTPEQIATFVASFVDNEVIPSLILWKSPSFIFVIDGGHRLSALRAWIEEMITAMARSLNSSTTAKSLPIKSESPNERAG